MSKKDISRKQRFLTYGIIYLIAVYPLHPAWSSTLTPTNKQIQISQQGSIPIINIATPNAGGISHNQFHAFNIGKPGVVINNAISPVSSQLAGLVNANPN
ncbi:hypothetical protein, partial [Proteus hauseri]|uniref:two-partner secretion domain-containing protein n=1 Tax=Proteus hauseri TaxID=183417 RepID=UPI0032D9DF60